jgi:hypothetical protein
MPCVEIPVKGWLLDDLSESFARDDPKAQEELNRAYAGASMRECEPYECEPYMVARVHGLSIKIFADEHPPPHFHVEYQGESASFSILSCEPLAPNGGLRRYEKRIRDWWQDNQRQLIDVWNTSRPSNCPVGPIDITGLD